MTEANEDPTNGYIYIASSLNDNQTVAKALSKLKLIRVAISGPDYSFKTTNRLRPDLTHFDSLRLKNVKR